MTEFIFDGERSLPPPHPTNTKQSWTAVVLYRFLAGRTALPFLKLMAAGQNIPVNRGRMEIETLEPAHRDGSRHCHSFKLFGG